MEDFFDPEDLHELREQMERLKEFRRRRKDHEALRRRVPADPPDALCPLWNPQARPLGTLIPCLRAFRSAFLSRSRGLPPAPWGATEGAMTPITLPCALCRSTFLPPARPPDLTPLP